jgi:hypothetical protein
VSIGKDADIVPIESERETKEMKMTTKLMYDAEERKN